MITAMSWTSSRIQRKSVQPSPRAGAGLKNPEPEKPSPCLAPRRPPQRRKTADSQKIAPLGPLTLNRGKRVERKQALLNFNAPIGNQEIRLFKENRFHGRDAGAQGRAISPVCADAPTFSSYHSEARGPGVISDKASHTETGFARTQRRRLRLAVAVFLSITDRGVWQKVRLRIQGQQAPIAQNLEIQAGMNGFF